jgi:hypothetical protein
LQRGRHDNGHRQPVVYAEFRITQLAADQGVGGMQKMTQIKPVVATRRRWLDRVTAEHSVESAGEELGRA